MPQPFYVFCLSLLHIIVSGRTQGCSAGNGSTCKYVSVMASFCFEELQQSNMEVLLGFPSYHLLTIFVTWFSFTSPIWHYGIDLI